MLGAEVGNSFYSFEHGKENLPVQLSNKLLSNLFVQLGSVKSVKSQVMKSEPCVMKKSLG